MTPTKWPEVALGEVCTVFSGFAWDSARFSDSGDLPVVRIRDVVRGRSETYYSGDFDPKFLVADGDVLIGMDGEFNRAAWQGGRALLNQRVCRITVSDPRLDDRFVFHLLPAALKAVEHQTPFATVKHLSTPKLKAIPVPVPPIDEQRRIASILDATEALRAKRRESLARYAMLTEAIFREMFTTDEQLQRRPLSDHLSYLTSGSRGWARFYSDLGSPFLRIENVGRDELHLSNLAFVAAPDNAEATRTRLRAGDVVMSITADLGRTAVVPPILEGGYINQHLCLMRSDTLSPRYLSAFLSSLDAQNQIERRNRQAVKAGLNFSDVRSLQIPTPCRTMQDEFSAKALAVDEARAQHAASTEALDDLFASLQQRAFRGDL